MEVDQTRFISDAAHTVLGVPLIQCPQTLRLLQDLLTMEYFMCNKSSLQYSTVALRSEPVRWLMIQRLQTRSCHRFSPCGFDPMLRSSSVIVIQEVQ
jgi:hypothetical protein